MNPNVTGLIYLARIFEAWERFEYLVNFQKSSQCHPLYLHDQTDDLLAQKLSEERLNVASQCSFNHLNPSDIQGPESMKVTDCISHVSNFEAL